jgi:hypothetical protein
MDHRIGVRAMRSDGYDGKEYADDAHQYSHAAGVGVGGVLGFDLDFGHGLVISSKSSDYFDRIVLYQHVLDIVQHDVGEQRSPTMIFSAAKILSKIKRQILT